MPNTSLPTNTTAGTPDYPGMLNVVHGEVNEFSRATGLRDITALLMPGWTATGVRIERVRDWVYLYWRGLDGSASSTLEFLAYGTAAGQIPLGFQAMGNSWRTGHYVDDSGGVYQIQSNNSHISAQPAGSRRNLGGYWKMASWRVNPGLAMPTTLPGTAV